MKTEELEYIKNPKGKDPPKDWAFDDFNEDIALIVQADIAYQLTRIADAMKESLEIHRKSTGQIMNIFEERMATAFKETTDAIGKDVTP